MIVKSKAYLETTIVSYLAAAPSRDILIAAHQQITREWWERRNRFNLFVSEAVVQEAAGARARSIETRTAFCLREQLLHLVTQLLLFLNEH